MNAYYGGYFKTPNDPIAGVLLVLLRGLLLWLLIPLGTVAWILTHWVSRTGLGNFLGWLDNNMIAVLQRTVFRVGFPEPSCRWVRFRNIRSVKHRIRFGYLA
ncbi:MAG: hypothetical protein J0I18_23940 [Actinobacteria bacterium]|nr:hypothetical protein [Actinomycetota bacterium]